MGLRCGGVGKCTKAEWAAVFGFHGHLVDAFGVLRHVLEDGLVTDVTSAVPVW